MANYSFKNPVDEIPDNSIINSGNFTQLEPNTEIMVGKTLIINGGNFTNVKKQPEWTINSGNFTQINRCSHNNPNLIDLGLVECETECEHMVSKEEVYIDEILLDTIYVYEDGVS